MTRAEIKGLMRSRRGEPYAERRIRAMIRLQVRGEKDSKTIMALLRELKVLRDFAKEKQLSL